jgi:hypothetical protein
MQSLRACSKHERKQDGECMHKQERKQDGEQGLRA